MEKSMWFQIRKNAGLTQKDVADKYGVSKQYISQIEKGYVGMPADIQIYYLSLRNTDEDKIIIKFLKEKREIRWKK